MYRKTILNNGLCVILNYMPRMESAAIGVWVKTGSRNEYRDLSGISHFLEHMVFKGTATRSTRKIKEEIEGRGGSLNGFTSEELTCYLAKVSATHIDTALSVLSDMVLHARVSNKDIERERSVIIEEIKMYRDLPNQHVRDMLYELMWPDHPLGLPIAGNIESVTSISRKNLLDYKKTTYVPENIVLVLSGNLNCNSVMKKIKKIFPSIAKAETSSFVKFDNTQARPHLKILYKGTEQTHISMGVHAFGKMHKDRYALSLLHIILGANMSSRLFENLREKRGLAYEIGTEIKRYRDTGAFIVNAGIEHKKIKEAIGLIVKELSKIKQRPVSLKELRAAKEYFKVQLSLALEDTMDHMLWLGEYVTALSKLPNKKEIIKKVNAVSICDLQRVAKTIFDKKGLNLAVIGPVKDAAKKQIEKELNLL